MDFTKTTLGELLSHRNETIKRNATSILKQLQRDHDDPFRIKHKSYKALEQELKELQAHITDGGSTGRYEIHLEQALIRELEERDRRKQ